MKQRLAALFFLVLTIVSGTVFAQSQAVSPPDQDGQMSQVQAIMQRAHQTQQQQRAVQQQQQAAEQAGAHVIQGIIQNSTSHPKQQFITGGANNTAATPVLSSPQATTSAITTSDAAQTAPQLLKQLSQLTQANALFQQQTNQRIDLLNQEHAVLQSKLTQLNEVLTMLNQEVTQLNQQSASSPKQLSDAAATLPGSHVATGMAGTSFAQAIVGNSKVTQYVLYAILILLVVVIVMLIPRRGGYKIQSNSLGGQAAHEPTENDTQDEYDFMNSDEAIPAKLDLARAYMAMEDYKSARDVLEQVLQNGNEAQRGEARKMLDKIPPK